MGGRARSWWGRGRYRCLCLRPVLAGVAFLLVFSVGPSACVAVPVAAAVVPVLVVGALSVSGQACAFVLPCVVYNLGSSFSFFLFPVSAVPVSSLVVGAPSVSGVACAFVLPLSVYDLESSASTLAVVFVLVFAAVRVLVFLSTAPVCAPVAACFFSSSFEPFPVVGAPPILGVACAFVLPFVVYNLGFSSSSSLLSAFLLLVVVLHLFLFFCFCFCFCLVVSVRPLFSPAWSLVSAVRGLCVCLGCGCGCCVCVSGFFARSFFLLLGSRFFLVGYLFSWWLHLRSYPPFAFHSRTSCFVLFRRSPVGKRLSASSRRAGCTQEFAATSRGMGHCAHLRNLVEVLTRRAGGCGCGCGRRARSAAWLRCGGRRR